MSNEEKSREPCAWCGGDEPPAGVNPRTLDPTVNCNPNFCGLARHDEARRARQAAFDTRDRNLAKVARLLGRPVTPKQVVPKGHMDNVPWEYWGARRG